ncbi:MAG: 4Fe-4S binding protein [Anaerolineaceae bacterium]|nr:4Fe-4S binding protein [Anaerolineaceae bacterium]
MAKRLSVVDVQLCVGCQACMFACVRRMGKGGLEGSSIHVNSAGGFRHGFVVTVCRACDNPPCSRVCPTDALTMREGGGVRLNVSKCIGCGNCIEACPFGAIFKDEEQNKVIVCTYCGYCADFCPYEVIVHEEINR